MLCVQVIFIKDREEWQHYIMFALQASLAIEVNRLNWSSSLLALPSLQYLR